MRTFVAKPVVVSAEVIDSIVDLKLSHKAGYASDDYVIIMLINGEKVVLNQGQIARYVPIAGDYFIRQADGYEYVNPKDVFERKYELLNNVE